MSGHSGHRKALTSTAQTGVAAVEFSLVIVVFLMLLYGIMEIARSMYMFNTLQEVTRAAAAGAANADFSEGARNRVRRNAIFRDAADTRGLLFGDPVTAEHIRIDYMALERVGNDTNPKIIPSAILEASTPEANRLVCMKNPNDTNCVRLIRVQVCMPGTDCQQVAYQPIFPLVSLPLFLPISRTIVAAETLGLAAAP
jgi:hypothetical protein